MLNGKINLVSESHEVALKYRSLGWPTIPIIPGEKRPPFSWKEYQDRLPTEQEITEWYEQCPEAGVAIITGSISGLVVVDIDNPEAKQELEERFGPLPETLFGHTSKGQHYYFRHPGNVHCKTCSGLSGIEGLDIRGDGGYIIAPPTVHPDGTVYTWEGEFDVDRIAELPASLLEQITKPSKSSLLVSPTWILGNNTNNDPIFGIIALLLPFWLEGDRHEMTLGIAGCLAKAFVPIQTTIQIITGLVEQAGDEELEDRLKAVDTTYSRLANGEDVAGISLLNSCLNMETLNKLQTLIEELKTKPGARLIDKIRNNKGSKKYEKLREIGKALLLMLESRGTFLKAEYDALYYFDRETGMTMRIGSTEMSSLMYLEYGLNPEETSYKQVLSSLAIRASKQARKFEPAFLAAYRNGALYIDAGEGRVYRLDGRVVDEVRNGDDGVYFEAIPNYEPWEANLENPLPPEDVLIKDLSFEAGGRTVMDPEKQRYVLWIYLRSLFFPELLPTKPMLVLTGNPGSGKTTALRRILRFLYGSSADVRSIDKQDALKAALTKEHFFVIDNPDSGTLLKKSSDQFCQALTGSIINLRELYTTNKLVGYRSVSFIALTTVEIPSLSPALMDRMLILKMDKLPEFKPDATLCNAIKEARPRLWGGLLHQLNKDLQAISANDNRVKFRMADWANFGLKVSAHEGRGEFFKEILEDLSCAQAHELFENSELPALFEHLVKTSRKGVSTAELHSVLLSISREKGLIYSFTSSRSLGNHLGKVFPGLQKVYSISREKGRNGWEYSW